MIDRGKIIQINEESLIIQFEKLSKVSNVLFNDEHRQILTQYNLNDNFFVEFQDELEIFIFQENIVFEKDKTSTISELSSLQYCSIIAMVLSTKPLTKTKGTDFLFSLFLNDGTGQVELKVFIPNQEDFKKFITDYSDREKDFCLEKNFEKAFKKGDILLINNIKRGYNESVAIIHKECDIRKIMAKDLSPLQFKYFQTLFFINSKINLNKIITIENIKENTYFDIIGKIIYKEDNSYLSICITDFTFNNKADDHKSSKYPNNMVLFIKLYGKHAIKGREISKEGFYLFKNVKINSIDKSLIGHMSESVEGDIIKIEDQNLIRNIKEREEEYFKNKYKDEQENLNGFNYSITNMNTEQYKAPVFSNENFSIEEPENQQDCQIMVRDLINIRLSDSSDFIFTKVENVKTTGLFFLHCEIIQYHIFEESEDKFIQLILSQDKHTIKVVAKESIASLLIQNGLLESREKIKCIVLNMEPERRVALIIRVFLDSIDIKELINLFIDA